MCSKLKRRNSENIVEDCILSTTQLFNIHYKMQQTLQFRLASFNLSTVVSLFFWIVLHRTVLQSQLVISLRVHSVKVATKYGHNTCTVQRSKNKTMFSFNTKSRVTTNITLPAQESKLDKKQNNNFYALLSKCNYANLH